MTRLRGPRPWPVRWFAALFLLAAALRLLVSLLDPFFVLAEIDRWMPGLPLTRDIAIVAANAQFTIACIPVALVWLRASRLARILVGVMAGLRLLSMLGTWRDLASPGWGPPLLWGALAISVVAAALLFLPPANRWIAMKGRRDAEVFE